MNKSLLNFWNKPYPALDGPKDNILLSIVFGAFVFLFLYVFQPFDLTEEGQDTFLITAGYGLITTTVMLINFLIFTNLVQRLIDAENWKLKHTFYASIWNLSTIAVGNYFYMILVTDKNNFFGELFKAVYYTLSIGVFPVFIILIYSEHRLLKNNQIKADESNTLIENRNEKLIIKPPHHTQISIKADVAADDFSLDVKKLIIVKADGNYSIFYLEEGNETKDYVKRISMKSVEGQLKNYSNTMRCHRSFIINIDKVKKVSGNARNMSLHFDNEELIIPISRAKEKEILSAIGHMG